MFLVFFLCTMCLTTTQFTGKNGIVSMLDFGQISISPDLLYQELDDESVILNLENEHYYSLGDVSTRIWELVNQHQQAEAVITEMLAEYEVEEATLRHDVQKWLHQFRDAGLISFELANSENGG